MEKWVGVICILSVLGLGVCLFRGEPEKIISNDAPGKKPTPRYARPRQMIQGFRYTGYHEGEKRLSIQCQRLSLRRKRVGFVRLGIMGVLELNGARIDIYGYGDDHPGLGNLGPGLWEMVQKDDILPAQVGKWGSVLIRGAEIRGHLDGEPWFSLTAGSMDIDPGKGRVVCRSRVAFSVGKRHLTARRLEFDFDTASWNGTDYALRTPGGEFTGGAITTNLYLERIP